MEPVAEPQPAAVPVAAAATPVEDDPDRIPDDVLGQLSEEVYELGPEAPFALDFDFDFGFNVAADQVSPAWDAEPERPQEAPLPEDDPLLASLTPKQREAAIHIDGPMIVTAGPGSGKTRVLAHRVAYLIARKAVPPWAILCVTFTNKAAQEMRERIAKLLAEHDPAGRAGRGVRVSTFHSFCAATLRRYGPPKRSKGFTIYDSDDQRSLIKRILKGLKLESGQWRPAALSGAISSFKNDLVSCEEANDSAAGFYDRTVARVYQAYEEALEQYDALDFDDLLIYLVKLLEADQGALGELKRRFRYVLVDEYQDTNRPQYKIALRLAGCSGNLFVVGDVDQSIYRWRGAEIRHLLDFEKDHEQTCEVRLEENFRSTRTIVDAAQALIEHNIERRPKTLTTRNEDGEPIELVRATSDALEARFVCQQIASRLQEGLDPREVAIFFRTNALSRRFEENLRNRGIRHKVVGAVPFYARREIKDLLACLRVMINENDTPSFLRVVGLTEGLGGRSFERVMAFASENGISLLNAFRNAGQIPTLKGRPRKAALRLAALIDSLRGMTGKGVQPMLEAVIEGTGYTKKLKTQDDPEAWGRLDNIEALISGAAEFDKKYPGMSAQGFLDQAAMLSGTQPDEDADDRVVRLMTLHAAKGLEFEEVYIVAVEDGLLPLEREGRVEDLEEERRLLYVGITRAKKRVTISLAAMRNTYGNPKAQIASRFLRELPDELIEVRGAGHAGGGYGGSKGGAGFGGSRRKSYSWEPEDTPDDGLDEDDLKRLGLSAEKKPKAAGRSGWNAGPLSSLPPSSPGAGGSGKEGLRAGSRVRHGVFGPGTVMTVDGHGVGRRAKVRFDRAGMKTLILQYAPLTVVS
jgi:DNA helicase-2/ATP-dependent DNA helicase PcrA